VSDSEAEYTVLTNDRKSYPARVIATDPSNDVAFVKIDATDLPVATLGDSDALQIGQTVIAIGNALGEYRNTVTKGIVSGLGRTVVAGDGSGLQETLEDVIQTDAAINPGNSGGPLVNLAGQVVGVNTAINEQGALISFSIPVNEIKKAVESVQKNGKIVRPMLGVRYTLVTAELKKQNNLSVDYGALVVRGSGRNEPAIIPDSPADRAGIVENDIILEIAGKQINQNESLAHIIQNYNPGDEITITFLHNDEEKTATVKLDELPTS
jgi:serine protease Do